MNLLQFLSKGQSPWFDGFAGFVLAVLLGTSQTPSAHHFVLLSSGLHSALADATFSRSFGLDGHRLLPAVAARSSALRLPQVPLQHHRPRKFFQISFSRSTAINIFLNLFPVAGRFRRFRFAIYGVRSLQRQRPMPHNVANRGSLRLHDSEIIFGAIATVCPVT